MKESPPQYGGLAAVLVFGIGLLIVGFSLPVEKHAQAVSMRWAGAIVLVFGLAALALSLFGSPASSALCFSGAALICCAALVYSAGRSELTGQAVYHHNFLARHGWRTEPVTRENAPDLFREATNVRWGLSIAFALASIGSFVFYRKTEYLDDF
jgi:hypothetical protein